MTTRTGQRPQPHILLVFDERLSREKGQILLRTINAIRRVATVELLKGSTTEEILLERFEKNLQSKADSIILVPWYRYLTWTRIEGHLGKSRNHSITFAGYFADAVHPYELEETETLARQRVILLDFANLHVHELLTTIQSLLSVPARSGIAHWLAPATPIYYESWVANQGLGFRIDQIMRLPGFSSSEWSKRSIAIRLCMEALWTLIFDEGPGKSELSNLVSAAARPKAYFQLGFDHRYFAMRLCAHMPGWTPMETAQAFWPNSKTPTQASQLLLKFSDFVRARPVIDTNEIEVCAFLLTSAPALQAANDARTLWIEPMHSSHVFEKFYASSDQKNLQLKPLPTVPLLENSNQKTDPAISKAKDRQLGDAFEKIRELQNLLQRRDEQIAELRSGGVGSTFRTTVPDADVLLQSFSERLGESRYLLGNLTREYESARIQGAAPVQLERLRAKVVAQQERERAWMQKLMKILQHYKDSQKKAA